MTEWSGWPNTLPHCGDPWPQQPMNQPPPVMGERVAAVETTIRHYSDVMRHFERALAMLTHQAQTSAARTAALESEQQRHARQLAVLEFTPGWISAEEARRASGARAKKERSEVRKEALALVQYIVAIALVVAAALGAIPWEHLSTAKSVLAPGP